MAEGVTVLENSKRMCASTLEFLSFKVCFVLQSADSFFSKSNCIKGNAKLTKGSIVFIELLRAIPLPGKQGGKRGGFFPQKCTLCHWRTQGAWRL